MIKIGNTIMGAGSFKNLKNPKMGQEDDMIMLETLTGRSKNSFTNLPYARQHTFYLSGEILGPEHYIDWFHTIRNAGDNDIIMIHINSPGGDLATTIQFLRAIDDCQGTVVTSVEGDCMSAATIIFLAADQFQISDYTTFMFHNYSSGMIGKGGELRDHISHASAWSEKFLRGVYKDFLTEAEIKSILDNKDIWLDGEEVGKRLEKKIAIQKKEFEAEQKKKTASSVKKTSKKENSEDSELSVEEAVKVLKDSLDSKGKKR